MKYVAEAQKPFVKITLVWFYPILLFLMASKISKEYEKLVVHVTITDKDGYISKF